MVHDTMGFDHLHHSKRKNAGENVIRQQAAVSAPFNASVTGMLAARDACNRLRINLHVSISRNVSYTK